MPRPNKATVLKISKAAALQAQGRTWEEIAHVLGYASASVAECQIQQRHKARYETELERAAREVYQGRLEELEQSALDTQERLMKEATDDIAQRAAHSLLNHASRTRSLLTRAEAEHDTQTVRVRVNFGADPQGAVPVPVRQAEQGALTEGVTTPGANETT